MVGYLDTGYLVLLPATRKLLRSKHVRCYEDRAYKDIQDQLPREFWVEGDVVCDFWQNFLVPADEPSVSSTSEGAVTPSRTSATGSATVSTTDSATTAIVKGATDLGDTAFATFNVLQIHVLNDTEEIYDFSILTTLEQEPATYHDAMRMPEAESWKRAYDEEIESMIKNQVWTLVPRPVGKIILDSR